MLSTVLDARTGFKEALVDDRSVVSDEDAVAGTDRGQGGCQRHLLQDDQAGGHHAAGPRHARDGGRGRARARPLLQLLRIPKGHHGPPHRHIQIPYANLR